MALDPSATYPGQVDLSDLDYPKGKARNVTVEGDGTGFPFEQAWVNDLLGFQQALLDKVGVTPSNAPDKVGTSQYLAAIETLIGRSFADVSALNWESFAPGVSAPLLAALGPDPFRFVSVLDAVTGTPWLVCRTVSTNIPERSRDFFRTSEVCSALSDAGPGVPIIKLCGDVNRTDRSAQNGLLAMSAVSKLYPSTDVGQTWGAPVSLGAVCSAVARSHPLGLVIVAGVNVIKTLTPALGSLTSQTVPAAWSALTPAGIATSRGGESAGAGAIIWPEEASTAVQHSLDGVTWTNTTIASGRVVSGTWSEVRGEWLVLTSVGQIYGSANPSVDGWTARAALSPASSGRFTAIAAFGRNVVIAGVSICEGLEPTGSLIVTSDFAKFIPLTTGISELGSGYSGVPGTCLESTLVHHDGRLVAGHAVEYVSTNVHPHLAASMRGTWI